MVNDISNQVLLSLLNPLGDDLEDLTIWYLRERTQTGEWTYYQDNEDGFYAVFTDNRGDSYLMFSGKRTAREDGLLMDESDKKTINRTSEILTKKVIENPNLNPPSPLGFLKDYLFGIGAGYLAAAALTIYIAATNGVDSVLAYSTACCAVLCGVPFVSISATRPIVDYRSSVKNSLLGLPKDARNYRFGAKKTKTNFIWNYSV